MELDLPRTIVAFALAVLVAGGAWRIRALTAGGAFTATIVGTVIVAGAGWFAGLLMVAFFVSSSVLSRLPGRTPPARGSSDAKRNAVQVLANGGIAAMLGAIALLDPRSLPWAMAGIAGSLAAATSDTWATEIGKKSSRLPRLITTGSVVQPGMSGGVTPLGTTAAVAGALFISALAQLVTSSPLGHSGFPTGWPALLAISVAGFGGAMADSFAGATVQARYAVGNNAPWSELAVGPTGEVRRLVSGLPFVTNDVVNLIATGTGAILGIGFALASA